MQPGTQAVNAIARKSSNFYKSQINQINNNILIKDANVVHEVTIGKNVQLMERNADHAVN